MYTTIDIPLADNINQSKMDRLAKIINRDYLVTKYITRVMKGKVKTKLSRTDLNDLFLSSKNRKKVEFDLKKQFKGYTREFQELLENAKEIIYSHIANGNEYPFSSSKEFNTSRRMRNQRLVNGERTTGTVKIIEDPSIKLSPLWLHISDPFNKSLLRLPLRYGKKLRKYLASFNFSFNDVRTIHLNKTTAHLTFIDDKSTINSLITVNPSVTVKYGTSGNYKIPIPVGEDNVAILSIDQGIRIRLTGTWLLPGQNFKKENIRYYSTPKLNRQLHTLDKELSKRQNKLNTIKNKKELFPKTKSIRGAIDRSRDKWNTTYKESDSFLTQALLVEVLQWKAMGWEVHTVIGYPKNIKDIYPKIRGKRNKRRSSRWRYKQFIDNTSSVFEKYNLLVIAQNESFTSKTCSSCGFTQYPKYHTQALQKKYGRIFRHGGWFECYQCGFKANADVNGAINIGRAYIITTLHSLNKKQVIQHQRKLLWWMEDRKFMKQLRKPDIVFKKNHQRWDYIKKMPVKDLKSLRWINYPTTHVSRAWQNWAKRTDCPKPVPVNGDLNHDTVIFNLLEPSTYFSPTGEVTN